MISLLPGEIIDQKYRIEKLLERGGFGSVYRASDISQHKNVAIKFDTTDHQFIQNECHIMRLLKGTKGVPRIYSYGQAQGGSYIAMKLLGTSIQNQYVNYDRRVPIDIAFFLFKGMLKRIWQIHRKGIVHQDIKPSQFAFGRKGRTIYLLDYGLSRRFMVKRSHVQLQDNLSRAGTVAFSSIANHLGITQGRKDDLESFLYSCIYLIKGGLPWQSSSLKEKAQIWKDALELKQSIPTQQLCSNLPSQLGDMHAYIKSLEYDSKPDYRYIMNLIKTVNRHQHFWYCKSQKRFVLFVKEQYNAQAKSNYFDQCSTGSQIVDNNHNDNFDEDIQTEIQMGNYPQM